jgi:hypothetical protein
VADVSLPHVLGATTYVQVADDAGRLVLLPAAMVAALQAHGITRIDLSLTIPPPKARDALSPREAVRLYIKDMPHLSPSAARTHIFRACKKGEIEVITVDGKQRLDATSFRAWRLLRRDQELDRFEEGPLP